MIHDSKLQAGGEIPRYQLKVTLKWSKPLIWRRVVVRADLKLDRLHKVIQIVMGWTDNHMHQFVVGRTFYGVPDPEAGGRGSETLNEKRHTIADLAPAAKKQFVYEYDFGDGWLHDVKIEKILPADPSFKHSVCLAGANAGPPEDCGGIGGYYNLLEILAHPKHPEYANTKEWLGEELDPAHFDLDAVNAALKRLKA